MLKNAGVSCELYLSMHAYVHGCCVLAFCCFFLFLFLLCMHNLPLCCWREKRWTNKVSDQVILLVFSYRRAYAISQRYCSNIFIFILQKHICISDSIVFCFSPPRCVRFMKVVAFPRENLVAACIIMMQTVIIIMRREWVVGHVFTKNREKYVYSRFFIFSYDHLQ